jgi:hypothetical protein
MELDELKSMWQSYDAKLEKNLKLNLRCVELLQTQKVRSKLAPLFWGRVAEVSFHGLAIVLLLLFLAYNLSEFPYAASAVLLLCFYGVATWNCIKQMKIIKQMDYSNDIVSIQSSLVMLQTNIVNHARLAVLCIPTFLAYPVVVSKAIADLNITSMAEFDIIAKSNGEWWMAQLVASIVLVPLCVWFYSQVTYRNMDKKLVRDFIEKTSGTRVRKAMEFVKELEQLKHDAV